MLNAQRSATLPLIGTVLLAVLGCSASQLFDPGPGKRVETRLAQTSYASGDSVRVAVTNMSSVSLVYPIGFCKTILQRQEGTDWVDAVVPPDGCALASANLDPRQTATNRYLLPSLPTGTYRLSMPMPIPRQSTTPEGQLTTSSFSVNADFRALEQ
jgi:hypothetical protein